MDKIFIVAMLLTCVFTSTVLVNSDPLTTTITSPSGKEVQVEPYHTKYKPDYLGNGAKWIWLKPQKYYWPAGCSAVFQTLFYSDCPHFAAKLSIAADDHFSVYINGNKVAEKTGCSNIHTFQIKMKCGLNNLTISVSNLDKSTPAGLIFSLTQDQSKCYNCRQNPAAFYNRDRCTCECLTKCPCNKNLHQWVDYPVCGCKCLKQIFAPCDPQTRFWSQKTCNCQCKKRWCPEGYFQDKKTCLCQCEPKECPEGTLWNPKKCQCDKQRCNEPQFCIAIKSWDPVQCKCVCPKIRSICQRGQFYDQKTCSCQPIQLCPGPLPQPYPLPYPLPYPRPLPEPIIKPYPLPYIKPCQYHCTTHNCDGSSSCSCGNCGGTSNCDSSSGSCNCDQSSGSCDSLSSNSRSCANQYVIATHGGISSLNNCS